MDGVEFPQEGGRSNRRIVFVVLAAVLALGAVFFFWKPGYAQVRNFFGQTAALVSTSIRGVLGLGSHGKLAAEIDLGGAPAEPQDNSNQAVAPVIPPPAHYGGVASAGSGGISESASAPQSKNSAEEENRNNSDGRTQTVVSATPASAGTSAAAPPAAECNFSNGSNPTRVVLINEIAWMGSPPKNGETAAQASNNEWLELKNVSAQSANLSGWQILDQSGKFKIVFDAGEKINAGKFYLLERTDDDAVPAVKADKIYSGALSNSGNWLRLFDSSCVLIDEINSSAGSTTLTASGWPGGDNVTKQTLERNGGGSTGLAAGDFGWHTSDSPGGTPKAENSSPAPAVQPGSPQAVQSGSSNPDLRYLVAVSIQGDGSGRVTSSPSGINCGVDCGEEYPSGTALVLSATPSADSVFDGWSGACGGSATPTAGGSASLTAGGNGNCGLTVATSILSVTAAFKLNTPPPVVSPVEPTPVSETETPTSTPPAPPMSSGGHVVISEIMAGTESNSSYEFIELYNPTGAPINLAGWELRKRNSSGNEENLVDNGKFVGTVPARGYFLIASPIYSGTPNPDLIYSASSANIAYTNNSVILYNGDYRTASVVDEVSWTNIPKGQSYERSPLDGNQFGAQPNPNPQNSQTP